MDENHRGSEIIRQGELRKRSWRLQRWTTRFFTLKRDRTLTYSLGENKKTRNSYKLSPHCVIADIKEETKGFFSFWLVWPDGINPNCYPSSNDSDDDLEDDSKPLKTVITEEIRARKNLSLEEKELTNLKAKDHNVALGVKLAAVTLGGVAVGLFTAGFGLIPYGLAVGAAAVTTGNVEVSFKSHSDSTGFRLILASHKKEEIISWHNDIKSLISFQAAREQCLPSSIDVSTASSLIRLSNMNFFNINGWENIGLEEGMRILQLQNDSCTYYQSRLSISHDPMGLFLFLMESENWLREGSMDVKKVDNHFDELKFSFYCSSRITTFPFRLLTSLFNDKCDINREVKLSRYWIFNDDGSYLIVLNTDKEDKTHHHICITISISPMESSKSSLSSTSLLSCSIAISQSTEALSWSEAEIQFFMRNIFRGVMLDCRAALLQREFHSFSDDDETLSRASISSHESHRKSEHDTGDFNVVKVAPEVKSKVTTQPGLTPETKSRTFNVYFLNSKNKNKKSPLVSNTEQKVVDAKKIESSSTHNSLHSTFTLRRQRFHESNLEESLMLRQQIAAKEYALHRIEYMISLGQTNCHSLELQQQLLHELKELKDTHLQITGIAYEMARSTKHHRSMNSEQKHATPDFQGKFDFPHKLAKYHLLIPQYWKLLNDNEKWHNLILSSMKQYGSFQIWREILIFLTSLIGAFITRLVVNKVFKIVDI